MIFLRNDKNCLNERSPAKMQTSNSPVEGLSNINKYPGNLSDIVCYDGDSRNQGLVGDDWACVNKTRRKRRKKSRQESVPTNLPDHPVQSIAPDMTYPMHFTLLV
ncbi:hypothetical protein TNCV_5070871 [Trichonephila clavipes]|nr:hypothetical protein TNCV_5070871 [Trichonephila clavipes]